MAGLPAGRFATVVPGDEVTHGKPHPAVYLATAAKLVASDTAVWAVDAASRLAASRSYTASDELARLLRRTDEATHRELALFALRCNGERRDSARLRDGGRPFVTSRGPRTGPLAIRARNAAGR